MTIESTLHHDGTVEMIKRLNDSIKYSRQGMRSDDFVRFEADMRQRIAELQQSVDTWTASQMPPENSYVSFTFSSSLENVLKVERGGPPPPRTCIDSVTTQRPAKSAGLSLIRRLLAGTGLVAISWHPGLGENL